MVAVRSHVNFDACANASSVSALRMGVSETSVKAAAGWTSSAMVSRYTSALPNELAMAEFKRTFEKMN
jgi:hypothetical protein